jgi:hypothetical protein
VLDDLIADEYDNEAALPGTAPGPAGQAAVFQRLWAALRDARFETPTRARSSTGRSGTTWT